MKTKKRILDNLDFKEEWEKSRKKETNENPPRKKNRKYNFLNESGYHTFFCIKSSKQNGISFLVLKF